MSASPTIWRRHPADATLHFTAEELAVLRSGSRFNSALRVGAQAVEVATLAAVGLTGALPSLYRLLGVDNWLARVLVAIALVSVPPSVFWTVAAHARRRREPDPGPTKSPFAAWSSHYAETALLNIVAWLPLLAPLRLSRPWLSAWVTLVVVGSGGKTIVPIVLLFRRTVPLGDDDALRAVEGVMRRAGVAGWTVEVVDQRSARHLGAWTQAFPLRRVLLSTSLAQRPIPQIEAAVAHELAHVRHHHRLLGAVSGLISAALMVAAVRLALTESLLTAFHASSYRDPAALPLVGLALAVVGEPLGLVGNWLARAMERDADRAAVAWASDPRSLGDLLKDLALDKRSQEQDTGRLGYLSMSHPPAAERIELLARWHGHATHATTGAASDAT